jgi:FkbM family methyltransferase
MVTDAYGLDWLTDVKRCWSSDEQAVIIDVGANIGRVTRWLATTFPRNQVHAFEPVSSTRETLRANVANLSNVTIHADALGDEQTLFRMTATPNSEINRIIPIDQSANVALEEVTGQTLDRFIAGIGNPQIGLLKIDAEGYDIKVIQGASGCLARGTVDLAVVECTFNPRGSPHVDALDLLPRMRQLAFEVVAVYSQNVGKFCRGSGYSDILFAHRRTKNR